MKIMRATCDFCGCPRLVAQSLLERGARDHGPGSLVWPQICEECADSAICSFLDAKTARENRKKR